MGFTVVPFGQGFKDMSPPTKELMKLTLEQKLAHVRIPFDLCIMYNNYTGHNKKRKKIEPNPELPFYIQTVRGVGYRFNKEA